MADTLRESAHQSTSRWTSPAYKVQFGQVAFVEPESGQQAPFHMSAWGLSRDLRALLGDYSDGEIRRAADWLTLQQNAMVANLLEQMSFRLHLRDGSVPPIDELFIAIEGLLFLPRGFRMLVTCVTNIISYDDDEQSLDKFVAILDPSEAVAYIRERRGMISYNVDDTLH